MTDEQAVDYCTQMTREHSSTFFLGSRFFSPDKRKAVAVIYAVCRSGDDAVDESPTAAQRRITLRSWWGHVSRAYEGPRTVRDHEPLELGLRWVLDRYDIPRSAFEELNLGLDSDIEHAPIDTMDELILYCRRVAGVVGLMIAPIAGYHGGPETLDQAVALGQAMQLTNILRDVGEDLRRDRCYLPRELLARYRVDIEKLRSGVVDQHYVDLLEDLAARTQALYRQGWNGIPRLHGAAATAVAVAALNYEGILRKLRQNSYDNLTQRAYLRPLERIALIPRAVVGAYGPLGKLVYGFRGRENHV